MRHASTTSRLLVAALAILAGRSISLAQCSPLVKLSPSDVAASDMFGGAMAISQAPVGTLCAVGVPHDNTNNGADAGSVRFCLRTNGPWFMTSLYELAAADGTPNDFFGHSVSFAYPKIAVGAPRAGSGGAVYMYSLSGTTWNLETKIPSPAGSDPWFGASVGVSGDWAIAGAPFTTTTVPGAINASAGAAYFYQRQANGQWTLQMTVNDADGTGIPTNNELGSAVAISGDVAVVGAPYGEAPTFNNGEHGYVHIFRRSPFGGWLNDSPWGYNLVWTNLEDGDRFGAAVSVDGNTIAIGAPGDDTTAGESPLGHATADTGTVYILRYSNGAWQPDNKIIPPIPTAGAAFGSSVVVKGDRVAIAAPGSKRAYIFKRLGDWNWVLDAEITDPDDPDGFGTGLAFDGTNILIGDVHDNDNGMTDSGAVYAGAPTLPPGDSCSAPAPVTSNTITGCTTFAALDGSTTCGISPGGDGADVWYAWTPMCSGNVIIDTIGSNFDTILSVHSSCLDENGSHTIVCNDDTSGFGHASLVTFDYAAGTTYLLRVSGYNTLRGDFTLRINQWNTPPNDSCSNPTAVAAGNSYNFSTCAASRDSNIIACMAADVADVWFTFTPTATGTLNLDTCGSNFDTVLSVYNSGICPVNGSGATTIACNDDVGPNSACGLAGRLTSAVGAPVLGGQPVLIRVSGFNFTTGRGEGVLNVNFAGTPNCIADFNWSGVVNSQDLFDFLACFFDASCPPRRTADVNHDEVVNSQDFFDFLAAFFVGC